MTDLEIQDRDRKKRYLKRYKKNIELINRLREKVAVIDERMTSVKSPNLSGMPRGGDPVTVEDLIAEKSEIEERIDRLKSKTRKLRLEALEKIDEIEDARYAEILESFFIDCKDFESIAEETGYTVRHVIRLYSEAINIISI